MTSYNGCFSRTTPHCVMTYVPSRLDALLVGTSLSVLSLRLQLQRFNHTTSYKSPAKACEVALPIVVRVLRKFAHREWSFGQRRPTTPF